MSFNYNELLKTKTDQVVGKLNWNGIDFSAPILDHVPENSYVIDSNPQIVGINPESEK